MSTLPEPSWVFEEMLRAYGPQHWWPADSTLEVIAGAVLVQNTAWRNAARAVDRLRVTVGLEPDAVLGISEETLAEVIRPCGTFRVKARRLRAVYRFLLDNGSVEGLANWPTPALRIALLAVHGVGSETADAILLYAFQRPVFIADAYARRLLRRLGVITAADSGYAALGAWVESRLPCDSALMNELHALVVRHCKETCTPNPRCGRCALVDRCRFGLDQIA